MKISLHIEADTPEEFDKALNSIVKFDILAAALQDRSESEPAPPWTDRAISQQPKPHTKPVEPEKEHPAHPEHPEHPEKPAKSEPRTEPLAAEAPVKAKRGRPAKAKAKPVDEGLTVIPVAEVLASAPAPVQAAPVQTGNGTGAATRQDLLDVFAEYVQRYGANFGYTDISGLLQKHIGEGVRKASDVPETSLGQAIAAIKAAILENPFNRKRDYA